MDLQGLFGLVCLWYLSLWPWSLSLSESFGYLLIVSITCFTVQWERLHLMFLHGTTWLISLPSVWVGASLEQPCTRYYVAFQPLSVVCYSILDWLTCTVPAQDVAELIKLCMLGFECSEVAWAGVSRQLSLPCRLSYQELNNHRDSLWNLKLWEQA